MKMKVYIAAPWVNREDAAKVEARLIEEGFEPTARWIKNHGDESGYNLKEEAQHDVEDLYKSDAILVLNLAKSEGKATEQGMAFIMGMPIIVVKSNPNPVNIFHNLTSQFKSVDNLEEALVELHQLKLKSQRRKVGF